MRAEIRHLSLDDIEAILPLWRESMAHHAGLVPFFEPAAGGAKAWRRHAAVVMAQGNGALLAAWVDRMPVGFILGQIQMHAPVFRPGRIGYISDLYVRDDYRRHGLGRLLFLALRDWFAARGVAALDLQVYLANTAAAAFWRAMGFNPYAQRMRRE